MKKVLLLIVKAAELAKEKGLFVVSGLHSRYHTGYAETIQRIHDSTIGDVIAVAFIISAMVSTLLCHADVKNDFVNPPLKFRPRPLWFWNNTNVTVAEVDAHLQDNRDQCGYGGLTPIDSGSVSGNVVTLKLTAPSSERTISYLAGRDWDGTPKHLLYGANSIAALTFCSVGIASSASAEPARVLFEPTYEELRVK